MMYFASGTRRDRVKRVICIRGWRFQRGLRQGMGGNSFDRRWKHWYTDGAVENSCMDHSIPGVLSCFCSLDVINFPHLAFSVRPPKPSETLFGKQDPKISLSTQPHLTLPLVDGGSLQLAAATCPRRTGKRISVASS